MTTAGLETVDDLLRELAPQVLGALVRRYGHFDACEDAVQEALLAAASQWISTALPDRPKAWLITVASRRLTDQLRSDGARRRLEDAFATETAPEVSDHEDTLTLLLLCTHPSLSPSSQIALTLRAVGGLTTAEIARAFFVPEATMAQRISRAKQTIKASGASFEMPSHTERSDRLRAVLHVLYLIFNEGYIGSSGESLQRVELTDEAIRLARHVRALRPDDGEVAGLLALMLLTDARRTARTGSGGELIPIAEQDRSLWSRDRIEEGVALISSALQRTALGPYQLQAAIAAVHDEAATANGTDWHEIEGLYQLLERMAPNPMVTLNHAVAVAMVNGPDAGLAMLQPLDDDPRMRTHHRLFAVRAHLLEMVGDEASAVTAYKDAARRTTSVQEKRYLDARASRLLR